MRALEYFPLIRAATAPSLMMKVWRTVEDILLVAGMLIGMVVSTNEVAILNKAVAAGDDIERRAVGLLAQPFVVIGMLTGMSLVEICQYAGRVHFRKYPLSGKGHGTQKRHLIVRYFIQHIPFVRCVCEPSFRTALMATGMDALMTAGMVIAMTLTHAILMNSHAPIGGIGKIAVLGVAMALGMGLGMLVWNNLVSSLR